MTVIVKTKSGVVTSYSEAWKDKSGRSVWTYRVDGEEPHDFETVEAAEQWIGEFWVLDQKEREKAGWTVEELVSP